MKRTSVQAVPAGDLRPRPTTPYTTAGAPDSGASRYWSPTSLPSRAARVSVKPGETRLALVAQSRRLRKRRCQICGETRFFLEGERPGRCPNTALHERS
jgi:hypothetical protein